MTRSLKTCETSIIEKQPVQTNLASEASVTEMYPGEGTTTRDNQTSVRNLPSIATRNEAICCEARNSLQVVLSGAEILLEDHLGNLLSGQKELLVKMTDNAYYLSNLLATLLGPEEFKLEEPNAKSVRDSHRVPAKV